MTSHNEHYKSVIEQGCLGCAHAVAEGDYPSGESACTRCVRATKHLDQIKLQLAAKDSDLLDMYIATDRLISFCDYPPEFHISISPPIIK